MRQAWLFLAVGALVAACASGSGARTNTNESEDRQALSRRFAAVAPEAVPLAERAAYGSWLGEELAHGPTAFRAQRVEDAVRFSLASPPGDAAANIVEFLLIVDVLERAPGYPAPEASRIRAALSRWVAIRLPAIRWQNQEELGDRVLRDATDGRPFLEIDPFAFALTLADRWRSGDREATSRVVCPLRWLPDPRAPNRGGLSPNDLPRASTSCASTLATLVLSSPATYVPRLVAALLERRDPALLQAMFVGVAGRSGNPASAPALVGLLRGIERDPVLLDAALVGMGASGGAREHPFWDERVRLWNEQASARASLLYGMGLASFSGRDFDDFARMVTARATKGDAALLLSRPGALRLVPRVWPLFERGAIGASELVPMLQAAGPGVGRQELREIAVLLCRDKRSEDLRILKQYFLDLRARAPGAGLGDLIDAFDPARCQPARGPSR